ncbi:putative T7SS-secreted protein [Streptomyces sp. NPDC047028]|uniref:putative T7SS-secreted protein n=1 Tax=Streptomyces sp. NPDC047028 TaxID=3155793 RepID=UPI0033F55F93
MRYVHLGFDPAPGSTDTVRDLHDKLAECAKVLGETHERVTKLLDGSYWKGDAAVAFREQLSGGPLPLDLKDAAHSLHKAARHLGSWQGELDEFQRRAKRLDSDAKDARVAMDAAKRHGGEERVTEAQSDLDKVIAKAKELAGEHEERAGYRARKIRAATKKLAPHEPGAWDKFTDWLDDNLPDILSACAAVLGVIALLGLTAVAPWVLFLAAGLLSGVAFGLRVSDPEVLASLEDGFAKGELDVDFWSNALGVTGDLLGMLPGAGAVAKGGFLGLRALGRSGELLSLAGEGDEALSLGQTVARVGTNVRTSVKAVGASVKAEASTAEGAVSMFSHPRVFGGRLAPIVEKIDAPATYLGAGTAVYGVASSLADGLDNDTTKATSNVLDGTRTVGVDLPATAGALHFLLRGAQTAP